MSNQNANASPNFSAEQLLEIVKAIKAPPEPTEAEAAMIEQDKVMRKERGLTELSKLAERHAIQAACDHTRIENGTSCCVHVFGTNNLNDYMICQACQAMIHGGEAPEGKLGKEMLENGHIFNSQLFNRHYRMTQRQTTF